jgi:Mn2+/Fe2+ NRAMP family transporter
VTVDDAHPAPARRRTRPLNRRLLALVAVLGPGLLAGLSDDDPAGITTYSVLGASYGYQLLWVLLVATIALVVFHGLGARMGVVTGQGLIGLVRQRDGVRVAALASLALVVANIGTTAAEFAGIAAGAELLGVPRVVSVPIAAVTVTVLVLRGSFHRVEHVLLALSAVFLAYVISGVLAHPSWGEAMTGLVVPTMPLDRRAIVIATATVGTTLAPWGLSFIQSYAVDKRLTPKDLPLDRVDVVTGAALTGVIGFFVVVACAATLHARGIGVEDAADAAQALEPLAGAVAGRLFGIGLLGAALLAASVLPLSTAYSVCEFVGSEGALNDRYADARLFYGTYLVTVVIGAGIVLVPGVPLVGILVGTQVLNAVFLLPLLVVMYGIARDPTIMGQHAASARARVTYAVTIGLIGACLVALLLATIL